MVQNCQQFGYEFGGAWQVVGPGQRPNATLAPIPQDTPHPTVHSLFYGDRDDSAELESTCTCRINPFSTAIYHCNAIRHSFLTATPYTRPPDTNDNQSQHENRHDHTIHATAASITLNRHDSGIASITLSEQDPRLPSVDPAHLTYFTLDERESRSANVIPAAAHGPLLTTRMHANFTGTGRLKLWTRWDWDYWARTMYKRKDRKVHPKNVGLPDGIKPGGKVAGEGDDLEIGDLKLGIGDGLKVSHGSRLTPARLERMKIGVGFLSEPERKLFIHVLYEFEGAIA